MVDFNYLLLFPCADGPFAICSTRPHATIDSNGKSFLFSFENDVFNQADRYYTNGLIFSYSNTDFSNGSCANFGQKRIMVDFINTG
ncbi:MAG: DUF2219 family protein [Bacteroidetes bacterium]|nr:DUF2219 family protein [Bacteroidota bacterium]